MVFYFFLFMPKIVNKIIKWRLPKSSWLEAMEKIGTEIGGKLLHGKKDAATQLGIPPRAGTTKETINMVSDNRLSLHQLINLR